MSFGLNAYVYRQRLAKVLDPPKPNASLLNLLDLPDCMLEQIFEYLSYDEIAKNRVVCQRFNKIGQGLLNMGFNKITKKHAEYYKYIKDKFPRRISVQRNHPLRAHESILSYVESRLSVLSMSFNKYIEVNLCCFIPGKVIDESLSILQIVANAERNNYNATSMQLQPLKVWQELADITSMAIDHFNEKIAPALEKAYRNTLSNRSSYSNSDQSPKILSFDNILHQLQGTSEAARITGYRNDPMHSNYVRMEHKLKRTIRKLNSVIVSHNRQAHMLRKLNTQVVDLRRRVAKPKLVQLASAPPSNDVPQVRTSRNRQPRTATMLLKRITESPSNKHTPAKKGKF